MKQHLALSLILPLMLTTPDIEAQSKPVQPLTWKVAGVLPAANGQATSLGVAGPVTGTHNNALIVAGGANFPDAMPWLGGKKKYYSEGFVFQRDKNDSLILTRSFLLPLSLAYAANCSTPQGLVVAGGENEEGLRSDVLLLQWDEAAQIVGVKSLPSLPFAVTNASLAFHQNRLYLAGGERANDVSNELWTLDLRNTAAGWRLCPRCPNPCRMQCWWCSRTVKKIVFTCWVDASAIPVA
ncbi:MAG: hypothetical protein M3Q06_11965 [Bacteroidota bacterium]|nr:hypothetical protein [Bacteroidota bacterium]